MAEAIFGVVASGFAVASLALELTEVAQKFHTFLTTCGQTGSRILRITENLALFQTIATDIIAICEENDHIDCGDAVLRSLRTCKKDTEDLHDLVASHTFDKFRTGFRRRKLAVLKIVLKDKTIEKIEAQLNGDVKMLLLALQPFYYRVDQQQFQLIGAALNTISEDKALDEILDETSFSENASIKIIGRKGGLSASLALDGRLAFLQFHESRLNMTFDFSSLILKFFSMTGLAVPLWFHDLFRKYAFRMLYVSANNHTILGHEHTFQKLFNTRLKILLPFMSFHLQFSNYPWSLSSFPIVPCESKIFTLCSEGDLRGVQQWIENNWISPFVVNQHGENLLHWAARNAEAETCAFLLQLGVDGAAYDDQLLTPLDHLARKLEPTFAYPSRVVNTIRALVERGFCQPLLPITSNNTDFYRGPEEGFAWLFNSEYGKADLTEVDSEQWTLLGDSAFNFGWCTEAGVDDEPAEWQSLYLLRKGANPHSENAESRMTPLDAYLRGCTAHSVDNASRWLSVISKSGLNLHEYARKEQDVHSSGQFLNTTWDEDLRKWVPIKFRVTFHYGNEPADLMVWIEDYDALGWFGGGKWDMNIFHDYNPMATMERWKNINSRVDIQQLEESEPQSVLGMGGMLQVPPKKTRYYQAGWIQLLALSLLVHYIFYLYIHEVSS